MRATTSLGIVSGFTALFTSTLGGAAIACAHPTATAGVVSGAAMPSISDIRSDLSPARETARLSGYAKFARAALAALSGRAADLADEISAAEAKDGSASILD